MSEVIDFFVVLIVAVVVAGVIGSLYAFGVRNMIESNEDMQGNKLAQVDTTKRTIALVCFGLCICIIIFALWLMIPAFH